MNPFDIASTKALNSLLQRHPAVDPCTQVERFVLKYIFFEAVLRIVLTAYSSRSGGTQSQRDKTDNSIRKNVVANCFAHFNINFSTDSIDQLLDTRKVRRGAKSARKLRDALVHYWSREDASEVEARALELLPLIESATAAMAACVIAHP